jgi:hypothetical protein
MQARIDPIFAIHAKLWKVTLGFSSSPAFGDPQHEMFCDRGHSIVLKRVL